MRLHRRMHLPRSPRSARSPRPSGRPAIALAGAALLAAVATGCGPTEAKSADSTVRDALDQLGSKEGATVVAELDASTDQVLAFLRENDTSVPGRSAVPTRKDAQLVARAQLTVSLGADKPLNERRSASGTRLAAALNFGDRDVFAYKAVGDKVYVRVLLRELSGETSLPRKDRDSVDDLRDLAADLPSSLGAAKAALRGKWVRIDPDAYGDFAWAVKKLTGHSGSGAKAREATSALDADAQRDLVDELGEVLREDATYAEPRGGGDSGEGDDGGSKGIERVTATLPARETADRLAPALKPLGVELRPSRVAAGDIKATVTVRRGELAGLTVDLRRLTGSDGSTPLPLRLTFSSGDALSTEEPSRPKPKKLEPQDVLAMVLYRADAAADKRDKAS